MRIKVAVGVIFDAQQRILITRRAWDKSHGGYWEFPGGKLEGQEDPKSALAREIREEVGIEVVTCFPLGEIEHDYPDCQVHLLVFGISSFTGIPKCHENQLDLRWVHQAELKNYSFPEANNFILLAIEKHIQNAVYV